MDFNFCDCNNKSKKHVGEKGSSPLIRHLYMSVATNGYISTRPLKGLTERNKYHS